MSDFLTDLLPALKMMGQIAMTALDSVRPFFVSLLLTDMALATTTFTRRRLLSPPRLVTAYVSLQPYHSTPSLHLDPFKLINTSLSVSPRTPVLPSYSPTMLDKTRLSPLPFNPEFAQPQFNLPVFYPTLDPSGRPQYVAVHDSPPRIGRRGSKQREWRSPSLSGIVEEKDEERGTEV